MNDSEQDLFEQELRRLRPAAPPLDFRERLLAARRVAPTPNRVPRRPQSGFSLASRILRWLVPATAVGVVAFLFWRPQFRSPDHGQELATQNSGDLAPAVEADHVQLEEKLLRSFDAVALLPGGEPIRFRCQEWMDELTVRDQERGVTIEQRSPRVEVIPVRFETY